MHQVYNIEQNFSYQASIEDKIFLKELSEQQSFSETDFLISHKKRNLLVNEFIELKSDFKNLTTRLDISYEYKNSPFGKALIMN
ncbi:MAG: hypothetical protein ACPGLU_05275, partial [Paracoccaceae bacterium]